MIIMVLLKKCKVQSIYVPSYFLSSCAMDLPIVFTLDNGVRVPVIGLGTFPSNEDPSKVNGAVKLALKLGYRHIDCANAYGNEKDIDEAIKESGIPRHEIIVTTKL